MNANTVARVFSSTSFTFLCRERAIISFISSTIDSPRVKKNITRKKHARQRETRCNARRQTRNENKDERLTILSRESPRGDQRWFLQAVADGNQRRMLDVGCRAFGWVVLFRTIYHSGKPTTPFASLAPTLAPPLSSPRTPRS